MNDDRHIEDDALPMYEEYDFGSALTGTTTATDDGRIDIDLNTKLARTLALVTRLPENRDDLSALPPPYSSTEWRTPLNIVIQVVGSRGDVQPFIALGQELQRSGHRVRIATHDVFREFVRQSNLLFFPIGGDPAELMAYMVKNPGLIPEIKTLRDGEIQRKRKMIRQMLVGCWDSCIKPDLETEEPFVANAVIANPPSFAHIHCAQALGIPVHIMFTMPWSPTQVFPHPLANVRPSNVGKGMANYLSYGLVQSLTWQGLSDVLNNFRKMIDLEAVPFTEGPFLLDTLEIPHTYCWSPSLVPKPKDWPDHIDVCGFFFREAPDYKPPAALREFLDRGSPPIYIGFGSIVLDDPAAIAQKVVDAVQICGTRAIISAGWSRLGTDLKDSHQDIFFLNEDCPHEWLFPRVSAVVHHGGAGTTACGLKNGRPTLVIPFFGDQYFWGDMVATAGAGPPPIRHRHLNSQNLSDAINVCLAPTTASKAATIAEGMKHENGVAAAVASFHRQLPAGKLSCDVDAKLPAIWLYKKSSKKIKLSGRVADILLQRSMIKSKDLEMYCPNQIHITNRRWEPTTAVASAMTSTSLDILNAGNSIWKAPYDKRKQTKATSATNSEPESMTAREIAALVGSSAMSIPRIYGAIAKGFLLDVPLAITEGLRATPRLYGEEVKAHDAVVDWKSGGVVAGKTFAENMRDAATDLYTKPAKGLEEGGVLGLSKGIGKSIIGMVTKPGAAMVGLIAYPAEGLSKSIHSTFHSGVRKTIVEARWAESRYWSERVIVDAEEETVWIKRFDDMCK